MVIRDLGGTDAKYSRRSHQAAVYSPEIPLTQDISPCCSCFEKKSIWIVIIFDKLSDCVADVSVHNGDPGIHRHSFGT